MLILKKKNNYYTNLKKKKKELPVGQININHSFAHSLNTMLATGNANMRVTRALPSWNSIQIH